MDVINTDTGDQITFKPKQIRRLGRGLRLATATGLESSLNDLPYTDWPGYWKHCRGAQRRLNAHVNQNNRQRKAAHNSRAWVVDSEDGAALARSKIWLPSDRCRQKPRLERQEAFRVPETVYRSDFVESDADLYRLGLLYDDEHARGSGFNLNTIIHSDLVYEVRPAKRVRQSFHSGCDKGEYDEDGSLILGQFLASVFQARSSEEDEAAQMHYPTPASTPLHVIHELGDDVTHSLSPPPAVNIFSDLAFDSEGDENCYCDWDIVPSLQRTDSDISTVTDEVEDDVGVTTEAWIVLGET